MVCCDKCRIEMSEYIRILKERLKGKVDFELIKLFETLENNEDVKEMLDKEGLRMGMIKMATKLTIAGSHYPFIKVLENVEDDIRENRMDKVINAAAKNEEKR